MAGKFTIHMQAAGAVVGASGLVGAAAALANQAGGAWRPAWFMFGFELVVMLTGVLVWMLGRGRFGSPAVGLVCAAGCILVASLFGFLGSGKVLWGMNLTPFFGARVVLAVLIAAIAGMLQLDSNPKGRRLLVRGAGIGAVAIGLLASAWMMRGQMAAWSEVLLVVLAMVGFVLVTGMIAASADCLIRAFSPQTYADEDTARS